MARDTARAMSRENVEMVRRSIEAFRHRELVADDWDPRGEWRPAMAGAVKGKVYRGPEEIRGYFDELFTSFSDVRPNDPEYTDLGERVLVLYSLSVRGRDSDLVIDQPAGALYELRGGRIVHAQSFLSRNEALEAAGLEE